MGSYLKTGAMALMLFCSLSLPFLGFGQSKTVLSRETIWLGYMTSVRFSEKYSVWNDFHFVPETFGVARTGLTHHLGRLNLTGGYAYLWLTPGIGNPKLSRPEHRPWGQAFISTPISSSWVLSQRVRYDARFRQISGRWRSRGWLQFS